MILSRARIETFEHLEEVYSLLQGLIDEMNSSIDSVNITDHLIIGKSSVLRNMGKRINFHFMLTKNENGTAIEIYDEYCNFNGPFKGFLTDLLALLETKISFIDPPIFDIVFREKTKKWYDGCK